MTDSSESSDTFGSKAVFLDTTVLANFARTDSVDWLVAVIRAPVTVDAVRQEVETGCVEGYEFMERVREYLMVVDDLETLDDRSIGVVPVGDRPEASRLASTADLDAGERQALCGAWPDDILASDDLDGRRLATTLGVEVTGSIGVLAYGVERGRLQVQTADDWLRTWCDHGYYSPVDSVTEVVSEP